MSIVFYGGAQLQVTNNMEYVREPQMDSGNTYLYTAHKIHFRCIYNPAATSYQLGYNQESTPSGVNDCDVSALAAYVIDFPPGVYAPTTDVALRHFLEQPRKQLVLIIGQQLLLFSPPFVSGSADGTRPPGQWPTGTVPCDANNGPVTTVHSIKKMKGVKTFEVDISIVTWINECYLYNKTSPPFSNIDCPLPVILSHRWVMTHDVDENLYTRRTIQGHAIFRTDAIQLLQTDPPESEFLYNLPDDFRAYLLHPVPANFKRVSVRVVPNEDGNRLDYVVVDEEQAFNLWPEVVAANVTDIDAIYSDGHGTQGLEDVITKRVSSGLTNVGTALSQKRGSAGSAKGGSGKAAIWMAVAEQVAGALVDLIPRRQQSLIVRVQGNRNSTRAGLYEVAKLFLNSRPLSFVFATSNVNVTEDLMGKSIQMNIRVISGPIGSTKNIINNKFEYYLPVLQSEEIAGVTQSEGGELFNNPHPVGGRGTYFGRAESNSASLGSCPQFPIPCDPLNVRPDDILDVDCEDLPNLATAVQQLLGGDPNFANDYGTE